MDKKTNWIKTHFHFFFLKDYACRTGLALTCCLRFCVCWNGRRSLGAKKMLVFVTFLGMHAYIPHGCCQHHECCYVRTFPHTHTQSKHAFTFLSPYLVSAFRPQDDEWAKYASGRGGGRCGFGQQSHCFQIPPLPPHSLVKMWLN